MTKPGAYKSSILLAGGLFLHRRLDLTIISILLIYIFTDIFSQLSEWSLVFFSDIYWSVLQGWVDYKSFVVRYNYSYFKNM